MYQIPPTPTTIPPYTGPAPLTNMSGMSLWEFAPEMVGGWNAAPSVGDGIQFLVTAMIIGGLVMMLIGLVNRVTTENE
jgi:hypothetical protein